MGDDTGKKDLDNEIGTNVVDAFSIDVSQGGDDHGSSTPNPVVAPKVTRRLSRKPKNNYLEGEELPLKERLRLASPYCLRLALVIPFVMGFILIGALIFAFIENRSYPMAVYWAVVTAATVGYGDVVPVKDGGKIYFVFYSLTALTLLMWCFSYIGITVSELTLALKKRGSKVKIPTYKDVIFSLVVTLVWLVALVALGSFGLGRLVNKVKDYIDYFYFTMQTLTTVGYGDFSGDNTKCAIIGIGSKICCACYLPLARVFMIFYILIGVTIFTARLGSLFATFSAIETAKKFKTVLKSGVTQELVETFDTDMSGDIDVNEFTIGFLLHLGKVDLDDVERIRLDRDGGGKLDFREVECEKGVPNTLEIVGGINTNYASKTGGWTGSESPGVGDDTINTGPVGDQTGTDPYSPST